MTQIKINGLKFKTFNMKKNFYTSLGLLFCIIIVAGASLFSCGSSKEELEKERKEYKFLVYYFCNGAPSKSPDTVKYIGYGENKFFLKNGDLVHFNPENHEANTTLVSGISRFEVYSIDKIYK